MGSRTGSYHYSNTDNGCLPEGKAVVAPKADYKADYKGNAHSNAVSVRDATHPKYPRANDVSLLPPEGVT